MGTITEFGTIETTQKGTSMRGAVVTDKEGMSLRLKLFDRWASKELAVGDVVACLYVQSQAGIQRLAGFDWCYSDASLMTIGKRCPCPGAVRVEVRTGDEIPGYETM